MVENYMEEGKNFKFISGEIWKNFRENFKKLSKILKNLVKILRNIRKIKKKNYEKIFISPEIFFFLRYVLGRIYIKSEKRKEIFRKIHKICRRKYQNKILRKISLKVFQKYKKKLKIFYQTYGQRNDGI